MDILYTIIDHIIKAFIILIKHKQDNFKGITCWPSECSEGTSCFGCLKQIIIHSDVSVHATISKIGKSITGAWQLDEDSVMDLQQFERLVARGYIIPAATDYILLSLAYGEQSLFSSN